jgi:hypothetical protein
MYCSSRNIFAHKQNYAEIFNVNERDSLEAWVDRVRERA